MSSRQFNESCVLGITLARGGSKGVKNKHLRNLGEKPLIDHTLDIISEVSSLDHYLVSTDSLEIQAHVVKKGHIAPFLRPPELSSDTASSLSAIQHAVLFMENYLQVTFSHIVEIMATNPFKESSDIDKCIEKIISQNLDSVVAVHQIFDHHPARVKQIKDDRIVDFCVPEIPESRRQDLLPFAYIRSGAIYAMSRDFAMNRGLRYETGSSAPYILPSNKSINIDEEIDFLIAETFLKEQNIE
jgi:CMP-N-acetylneuraminic acid synthetase